MNLEKFSPEGVVAPFLKTSVTAWPGGMSNESAEIEDPGVRGWPVEPAIDGTIE